jgi:dolichol-phosphate mannosyltransferase
MLSIYSGINWAAVVPMSNEAPDFDPFILKFKHTLDNLDSGKVFLIVDKSSKDNTRELCEKLESEDPRFTALWAPDSRSVVDAYLHGYRVAYDRGYDIIIEMDAGLSHDPRAIPMFLRSLNEGNECSFGSRFINGGSMVDSPWQRRLLSKAGTFLAQLLLGCKLQDATSGFQGFHREIVKLILDYGLLSKAHFYQTEVRHLLRNRRYIEVPIHYRAPSPRVSQNAIKDSLRILCIYILKRLNGTDLAL